MDRKTEKKMKKIVIVITFMAQALSYKGTVFIFLFYLYCVRIRPDISNICLYIHVVIDHFVDIELAFARIKPND
jgi:hypothetical protein